VNYVISALTGQQTTKHLFLFIYVLDIYYL